ncbi:MAG: hypothetical protein Q9195_006377 [Heterodermia aff. obscurata]
MSNTQTELTSPPTDAISSIQFAPASLRLLVASWDKSVYLYDTTEAGGRLLRTYEHRAPVLDVCFGEGDEEAFTGGLDWAVRRYADLHWSSVTIDDIQLAYTTNADSTSIAVHKQHSPHTKRA